MITITCKCGQTSSTFISLKEKDFPEGWATDCCAGEAPLEMPTIVYEAPVVYEDIPAEAPASEQAPSFNYGNKKKHKKS